MRRVVLRVCCLLALVSVARAQATWAFTAGTGVPTLLPSGMTGGTITATNATLAINSTSPSSTAPTYASPSGGNNASVGAVAGTLSTASSSYFEFTLTATAGNRLFANALSLGTRSTGSGPTSLALYSSANSFATAIGTASVSANSNWALVTFSGFSLFGPTSGALTFRIYASGGTSATAGNWRIDDVSLSVSSGAPGPAIATQPASQSVPPGSTVSLSVVAAGSGTVSYQWRKGGVALSTITYPSATTATLNLGVVATGDSGSYDVVVTDSIASITSSAAVLNVSVTPATVILGALSATYDGNAHAVTATTTPPGISLNVTYNGQLASPPTNAGTYAIVATITDPAFSGSATGNLVIAPAPQTIAFNTNSGFAPLVGVPFNVSATATGTNTPSVKFSVVTGNATATGTNNATITVNDTVPVTIAANQAGDANNAPATQATAIVSAVNPAAISGTYTQTFDTLATAMPAGWRVFIGATSTSLGTDVSGVTSSLILGVGTPASNAWGSTTGNFRNVASALNGGVNSADSSATQAAYTNRALGVRQGHRRCHRSPRAHDRRPDDFQSRFRQRRARRLGQHRRQHERRQSRHDRRLAQRRGRRARRHGAPREYFRARRHRTGRAAHRRLRRHRRRAQTGAHPRCRPRARRRALQRRRRARRSRAPTFPRQHDHRAKRQLVHACHRRRRAHRRRDERQRIRLPRRQR